MRWRAMIADDLDGVVAVARIAFPDHPEGRACFAERLALVSGELLRAGGRGRGGRLSHRLSLAAGGGSAARHAAGRAAGESGDSWYLHDLALLPEARGGGKARAGLALLFASARRPDRPRLGQ
jgi:hypothetical protein